MIKRIFSLSVSLFIVFQLWAQSGFETAVSEFLKLPEYKNASIGMHIIDLASGETVYNLDADKMLVPASTMKLISTATAFEILGSDYRFETKVGFDGNVGKNGELNGDIVLIGGADPALGSEYFQEHYTDFLKNWALKIKEAGIKKVNGNLVLDGSVFDTERVPDTWIWGDIGNYYGAGPNAFSVYDNMFCITFSSPKKADKLTKVIATYPKIEGMTIDNEVRSADDNTDNAYVFGGPFDKTRIIRGTIPKDRKAFTIKAAIHKPEEILANDFLKALAAEGVFVRGQIQYEKVRGKDFETVYIQESPTLTEIGEVLNHKSVNLFAEHFLKQIALEKNGYGNRNQAIEILKEFWEEKGISTEYLFMEDGSGLSHFDAVSPHFFTQLLSYMSDNDDFVASLPVAGEGTLKSFDTNLLPGNTFQAKSGSMTRVRCYSGYLKADSGKTLVLSMMFNHFSGSHSDLINQIEKLVVALKSSN